MKTKKSIVNMYSTEIEALTRETRRWITKQNKILDRDEIAGYIEDTLFDSPFLDKIEISDIKTVIESVRERTFSKYGILNDLLESNDVNEIMVNGPNDIYIERNREILAVDNAFTSEHELEEIIRMFATDVHREINEANPIVDARLKSGYRVNGVLNSVAINGPILTIRKFSNEDITLEDLVNYGSVSEECARDLAILVNCGYNVFISGGTSSGKTTFLNALAGAIDPGERVIVIEDSAELKINNIRNKVHMECRNANSVGKGEVSMEKLIRTSLRMRPDRIIVGEVRGREVVDMIQAMNTGHQGSLSTGHGNSIKGMLNRLETMYMMDAQIPIFSVKSQISNAIDVFIHLNRDSNGQRQVVEVAELYGFDGEDYIINYLYLTNENGKLVRTENKLLDRERLIRNGYAN